MNINTFRYLRISLFIAALLTGISGYGKTNDKGSFTAGNKTFLLNGRPFTIKAAELHYPRIPRQYWQHRIQMCKALGMNTICMYVFWNIHEPREGRFDFSGQNDIAGFCRLAQQNGMYVIVRPGPYVCAEWEMGGLPWWLLKKKDIRLREQDPYFMERVRIFMKEVGQQLAPLTIQNGGPIIMVQVENEYGSYGEDKAYVSAIRDIVRQSGFDDVTLFQCDWASNFTLNGLDDLIWTMNFGTGSVIDDQFRHLRELRPESPLMCSEYWSGWFDKWGAHHETRPADDMTAGIDEMLTKGISFSLYMTHGGTSFGHWAGANSPGFAPDVTSYDYDAPINEYGMPTEKYYTLRKVMQKHSATQLPPVPEPVTDIISVPVFSLTEYAPLAYGTDTVITAETPLTFEDLDMGWGSAIYTTTLPETDGGSTLNLACAHDYATVYVDGEYVGRANRVSRDTTVTLPRTKAGSTLTIVVEGMGRINFGRAIKDHKGVTGSVTLHTVGHEQAFRLNNWTMMTVPDEHADAERSFDRQRSGAQPAININSRAGYYRGRFYVEKPGDTFLNMQTWGKGQVYVNGYAIGRFWNIGPQQTLYVPGCWLRAGYNEIIVLDMTGPEKTEIWGQDKPELNMLQLEDAGVRQHPSIRPDLKSIAPAAKGSFTSGEGWQTVRLNAPRRGRYIAVECLNTHGSDVVSVAEIRATDTGNRHIGRETWSVKYADSENKAGGNHTGDKAFDLQESTYWSTTAGKKAPHLLVIDMGTEHEISSIEYLPGNTHDASDGIRDYKIYVY